jgi:NADH dehydrogenase FAD-containing subunit
MSAPKTVLVLGGGVGGLVAARELRKRLPREHRVVLVDRQREHLFAPSLLWPMVGQREAGSIKRPPKKLEPKGIEVRFGEIENIDPQRRAVTVLRRADACGDDPPAEPALACRQGALREVLAVPEAVNVRSRDNERKTD